MSKKNNIIKQFAIGKKCALDFDKTRVVLISQLVRDGKHFHLELLNSKQWIKIHEGNLIFHTSGCDYETTKVIINYPQTTTGKVLELKEKFIVLEITNYKTKKTYHNIIPLKCVRGIKVYDEDDDNILYDESDL